MSLANNEPIAYLTDAAITFILNRKDTDIRLDVSVKMATANYYLCAGSLRI